MHRIEKLRSNIETLKDSLALDWSDLSTPLTGEQRVEIETHLEWCLTEMDWCLAEMKKLSQRLRDTIQLKYCRRFSPLSAWLSRNRDGHGLSRTRSCRRSW